MKSILFLVFAWITALYECSAQERLVTSVVIGGQNLCSELSIEENGDDAPEWNDIRINSNSGRKELIEQATLKAFNRLGLLGEDSWFNRYMVSFFGANDCIDVLMKWEGNFKRVRKVKYLSPLTYWASCNPQLKFNVSFNGIKRKSNTAGASLPKIERIISEYRRIDNGDCYCGNDLVHESDRNIQWGVGHLTISENWDKTPLNSDMMTPQQLNLEKESKCKICKICYRENLNVIIEVNPEIFDRGYLKIPSEDDRYARDPTEAVMYIILHELGHLESFLSKESKCWLGFSKNLTKQDNSEESAWEFASSVMHYEEDLDLLSIFEKCIDDMPNKFSNLKLDYLKDLPSFYLYNTNLPILTINDLQFEAEILEAKKTSGGIGLVWAWDAYSYNNQIDQIKAENAVNSIIYNGLLLNHIGMYYSYEENSKEIMVKWYGKYKNSSIELDYSIGKEGNAELPNGKVRRISLIFDTNL